MFFKNLDILLKFNERLNSLAAPAEEVSNACHRLPSVISKGDVTLCD